MQLSEMMGCNTMLHDALHSDFQYGEVNALIISSKRNGSAIIEMASTDAAVSLVSPLSNATHVLIFDLCHVCGL